MQFNESELKITLASFEDAISLQDAIGVALKGTKLDIPSDLKAEVTSDMFSDILGAALGVATSKNVRECLFKCAERAMYGQSKVDRDFFDLEKNRELYFPIMVEIVKANIGPFIKGLASQLGGLGQLLGNNQK